MVKTSSPFYLRLDRNRVKRRFLISNVSMDNTILCRVQHVARELGVGWSRFTTWRIRSFRRWWLGDWYPTFEASVVIACSTVERSNNGWILHYIWLIHSKLHSCCINKYNTKLHSSTNVNFDYMFRLKLDIIKSIPDIFLLPDTPNLRCLEHNVYHILLI